MPFVIALSGCPGGDGGLGAPCSEHDDCDSSLQCVSDVCVLRCQRAPECGDGYACDDNDLCVLATGQNGDACHSETDCAPGLSCQVDNGTSVDGNNRLLASCTAAQTSGKPTGAACELDSECRNGTCALGRCVDLCSGLRDCGSGTVCMATPRVAAPSNGQLFDVCLPAGGNIAWSIPIDAPAREILLPIPSAARSATIVFRVDDTSQRVGASLVEAPDDDAGPSYEAPCRIQGPNDPQCNPTKQLDQYYATPIRHRPELGQSVLQIPSGTASALQTGAYRIGVQSFRPDGSPGSAIPHVTAILKMDAGVNLDLHFHFLDLDDHPCEENRFAGGLDAEQARDATYFQTQFVGELRTIFAAGGIFLGNLEYDDLGDLPDFDTLALDDAPGLFSLGQKAQGIDIYFVRMLSPVGLQAFGPNPGPAGLAGTRQSGIAIGIDTLCYRTWPQLARLTAHEIARYMGLYHNVEVEFDPSSAEFNDWVDKITDNDGGDPTRNLMFYSEFGGTELSPGQREILTKSAVLR